MTNVLMVCLGNICRSPAAEAVMQSVVAKAGREDVMVDSAGTAAYHQGENADPRMIAAADRRGLNITSLSRPVVPEDFERFQVIVAMDESNLSNLKAMTPSQYSGRVVLMTDFCKEHEIRGVPDPYYGELNGFDYVLDILEDGCPHLLASIDE